MKVALLANLKQNAPIWPGMSPTHWDHLASWETIQAITIALEKAGHQVIFLEGDETLYNNLRAIKPDICFNLCEGHFGNSPAAQVPAILEMLRIPYSGSHLIPLGLDKPTATRILSYHGLPTPPFQLFEHVDEALSPNLRFPLRIQPCCREAGRDQHAPFVVSDPTQLQHQLQAVFAQSKQAAFVEQYIEGKEIIVGIVGNLVAPAARRIPDDEQRHAAFQGLHIFPLLEAGGPTESGEKVNSVQTDLTYRIQFRCPAPLEPEQTQNLKWLAAAAFRVLGGMDVIQVKIRLDVHPGNKPYIVQVDPLPRLRPNYSELCLVAAADGWRYETLANRILDEAIKRYGLNPEMRRHNAGVSRHTDEKSPSLELV